MPLRWASCLFRPTRGAATSLEVNSYACPAELQEQLDMRGTACLRPRGAQVLYERVDDAGQGAFTPPVLIYIKRLPLSSGLEVCVKRTLITHFVGRAAREARLQVQLQHPHLLPALASLRGRHHYYLVLPAAEGDLWSEAQAMRQEGGGYSEDDLRSVARQALLGLEHLHASNMAHRDIKPANILRMPDGRVAVADFGCSDGCTAGFVAAGTTQFQPPECRRNRGVQLAVLPKGYDQRAQDMWGVGATLASLWFARLPEVVRGANSRATTAGTGASGAMRRSSMNGSSMNGSGFPTPAQGSLCGEASSGDASAGTDGEGGPNSAPPCGGGVGGGTQQLPRFLAVAGFAGCGSTVGACGAPMSAELLDLLAGLLRLRPGERLSASQALQHAWLGGGGGSQAASLPQQAVVTPPSLTQPTASSPSSPLKRLRTSADGRFPPFLSQQQLLMPRTAPSEGGRTPRQYPQELLEPRRSYSPVGCGVSPSNRDGSSASAHVGDEPEPISPLEKPPRGDAPSPPPSPWLQSSLQPGTTKRSAHAVLRVFVGAGSDASGSN